MGVRRWDRTWLAPAHTRHAWLRDADHPNDPPRQVFILAWRRQSYRWSALIIYVIETVGSDPIVVQRWAAVEQLRPVRADPNGVFGLR